jgi:hypothetical protein
MSEQPLDLSKPRVRACRTVTVATHSSVAEG